MRPRRGFTLLELMIVTVIIAILGMLASIPIRQVRERSFISAAKQDVRNLLRAIAIYQTENLEALPTQIGDLSEFEPSPGMMYCAFSVTTGASPSESYVTIEAVHKGAETGVTTRFPMDNGALTEKKMPNCTALTTTKTNKGKRKG